MIPKIIHYCWFGPKALPEKAKSCIESWKKFFPDYELRFWNESNSPIDSPFPQTAYEAKKYAFVADYVRTWALNKFGGLYFDTDVLVIKPFTPSLLNSDGFLAYEQEEKLYVNVAVWASVPNSKLTNKVLNFYNNNVFDNNNIFKLAIPIIVTDILKSDSFDNLLVLDYDYFYPFPQKKRRTNKYMKYVTDNTLAVHLWDFSWLTFKERVIEHLKMFKRFCGLK